MQTEHRFLNESLKGAAFLKHLPRFLSQTPDFDCPSAGRAAYSNAIVADYNRTTIIASSFRTYFSVLKDQTDFINALESANAMTDIIKTHNEIEGIAVDVFPYSIFFIFFEQYLTVVATALTVLGIAVGVIFVMTAVILGDILLSVIVAADVIESLLHPLNARTCSNQIGTCDMRTKFY